MSASFLHYAQGLRGVQYKSTQYIEGSVKFNALLDQSREKCPTCDSSHLHFKDSSERKIQMCPVGNKPCWLYLSIRRRYCTDCYNKWWPHPPFVSGKRRMTRSFERYIISLTGGMTLKDISVFLGISWRTVRDIHKEYLKRIYSKPYDLNELIYLGIDEFSIGKNHDYMTIFINLETGQIIYAIEGRNKRIITPFLKKIAEEAGDLQAVAMDMSGPYKSAVKEFLPSLDIVFDRFHVMKLMNKAIDEIRREQHLAYRKEGIDVLKGSRYLMLKNIDSLNPEQRTGLQILLDMNAPLACAHMLKEQLREFWNKSNRADAEIYLLKWLFCGGMESGIPQLVRVARTLLHHGKGLLDYYNHKITNATTEGINNKIATLQKQAYGYSDMEYFKLRLYHLHKQKSELVG